MPEWITHVALAFALASAAGVRKKSLALVGAILPDVLSKIAFPAAFLVGTEAADSVFGIGHTPIVSLLASIVIASLLPGKLSNSLKLLSLGWASHFALDALQGPFGQQLLWPFSNQQFGFFLWWSDSPLPLAITLIALASFVVWKTVVKREKIVL